MKRSFRMMADDTRYDAFLLELLRQRLTCQDGLYVWPREVRSALVYWSVDRTL